jgi:hypothetical protein
VTNIEDVAFVLQSLHSALENAGCEVPVEDLLDMSAWTLLKILAGNRIGFEHLPIDDGHPKDDDEDDDPKGSSQSRFHPGGAF